MPSVPHLDEVPARWERLEEALARLHDAARRKASPREFYDAAIRELAAALPEVRIAVWGAAPSGRGAELLARNAASADADPDAMANRRAQALAMFADAEVRRSGDALWQPVVNAATAEPAAVIELALTPDAPSAIREELPDVAGALAAAAADFHAFAELRRFAGAATIERQAVDLLRRLQAAPDLASLGYAIANEGRRVLGCERLTLLVRRGRQWRVLAASGVDHVEPKSAFAQRIERFAPRAADWGEPLAVGAAKANDDDPRDELPPPLAEALAAYLDHSHARTLAAAPAAFPPLTDAVSPEPTERPQHGRARHDALVVAEWFHAAGPAGAAALAAELAELCAPSLARAQALDGPLARRIVRRALARASRPLVVPRGLLVAVAVLAGAAALTFVETDFEVEAPAVLMPVARHEIFATTTGRVAEVRVVHGQTVAAGDVLVVLDDPQLQLQREQVAGELAAVERRIDALAVARTDRTVRESADPDALPPGAEQQQLIEKRASLRRQRELLARRRTELTLVSPVAGQVLTRDIESLLASRPVERGQALLTIADTTAAWELIAEVDQRDVGHVVAQLPTPPVRFRLAGDVDEIRTGRVDRLAVAATLDVEDLSAPAPPAPVHVAVDADQLAEPRAGTAATVRIHCGRRSLGYVWLHDLAATVYRWWMF
ncbi:MAG: biotin/lipoyl-binding protein [Pirellulales bacterium]|nr:biotin/lipoyl-binding protein [Pirellulales bacterium]